MPGLVALALLFVAVSPYRPVQLQWQKDSKEVRCPSFSYVDKNNCDCVADPDGLDFTCSDANLQDISAVIRASRFAIKSLHLTSLNSSVTCLCEKIFANGSVSELRITSSRLAAVNEHALDSPRQSHTLQSLVIRDAQLTMLPRAVGNVPTLRRLDLEANAIQDVYAYTFFGSSKLAYMSLRSNRLKDLAENAFLGLEGSLRELILEDNAFRAFPLSAVKILKKLQSLNLARNEISNVTFETFTRLESLRYLDLSRNRFSRLERDTLASMQGLKRLTLRSNRLRDVHPGAFDHLHDLESLDLGDNSLSALPADVFAKTSRLAQVDLSRNRLQRLAGVFVELHALEEIRLQDNLLLALSADWFRNSANVRALHLERNVLVEVEEGALVPLKRLAHLHLSHNFLHQVDVHWLRYNMALLTLALDHNHLSALAPDAFRGVPRLTVLRLEANNLRAVSRDHFAGLSQLAELHLQDNRLADVEPQAFSGLANLQHLDLRGNRLLKLDDVMMRYPSALRTLRLDANRLSGFHRETFSGQTTAEILSLRDNRLDAIPAHVFEELINLYRLDLSLNRIAAVEDRALIGLHQLRFLNVSHNRLTQLTPLTLRGLQLAEQVDLSHNRLGLIEAEAFSGFHHLKKLDLSHNRLRVLKSGAFRGCLTLGELNVASSGIRTIQANALNDLKALDALDIRDNELIVPDALYRLRTLTTLHSLTLSGNGLGNLTAAGIDYDDEPRGQPLAVSGGGAWHQPETWIVDLQTTSSSSSSSGSSTLEPRPTPGRPPLNLDTLEELEYLELENCSLTNLTSSFLSQNKKLKVLKLGGNRLSGLERGLFRQHTFLKELHLDRNAFTAVPAASLKYMFNLHTLNLSGNHFVSLGENNFDNVIGLRVLDLSDTKLNRVTERVFHNVTMLTSLDISSNYLSGFSTSTFVPLSELSQLRVQANRLPYIPVAIQGLRALKDLELSMNPFERLKELPESKAVMLSMESVRITDTNLTTISPTDFDLFRSLKTLHLERNKITRIAPYAFRSLTQLESLDLSQNELLHLSRNQLQGLRSLQSLNLSHNQLGSLDTFPTDLFQLQLLDVSHNRLTSISRDSLRHLPNLVRLDLSGNMLTELLPKVLSPLTTLRALDLSANQFSTLPLEEIAQVEETLEMINLEGNPMVCSCSSYSQKLWLRAHRKWIDLERRGSKVGPQCAEPEALKDRYLLTVKDSELCPLPSVSSLTFTSMDPYNFLITWESPDTNMTGLKGFIVAYHRLDRNDQVKKYKVGPQVRGFRVQAVSDNTLYLVCVITRGSSYTDVTAQISSTEAPESGADGESGEGDDDDDDSFYVMPLGDWSREERSAPDAPDEDEDDDEEEDDDDASTTLTKLLFPVFGGGDDVDEEELERNRTAEILSYPSSNDTDLMVDKPAVVNLGSQSSKCIQVRTTQDPAKLSLIDDRKLSAVIGVSMGLLVFIGIIISILTAKNNEDKEDEIRPESAAGSGGGGSHKSPKSREPSLKNSRTNSLASSIANRLVEATAETTLLTAAKPKPVPAPAAAATAPGPSQGPFGADEKPLRKEKGKAPKHGKRFPKQSSSESRRSSSDGMQPNNNGAQAHNSSDALFSDEGRMPPPLRGGGGGRPPPLPASVIAQAQSQGQQSWHGTPRADLRSRTLGGPGMGAAPHSAGLPFELHGGGGGGGGGPYSSYSTTLPRRSATGSGEFVQRLHAAGSGMSLDSSGGALPPPSAMKRHPLQQAGDPGAASTIPLLEYARPSPGPGPPPRWRPPPPTMRCHTFDASNPLGGPGLGLASSQQRLLSNHISGSEDLDSIDYYPEVGGRPATAGVKATSPRPPRPFIKYNSFANY